MLQLVDVYKTYGEGEAKQSALHGVSASIESGKFVALMGPSGCGKSTLLHIAGAMDQASSGTVSFADRILGEQSNLELAEIRRRHVGFVFQAFNLLPTLNALENVSLPLLLDGKSNKKTDETGYAALEQVGLLHKSKSYPSQLSGGEMQRVAIARAVAIKPKLLIADEPTGSLDSENGEKVLNLLSNLNQELGITILMATHSEDAAAYAQRCLRMFDGHFVD